MTSRLTQMLLLSLVGVSLVNSVGCEDKSSDVVAAPTGVMVTIDGKAYIVMPSRKTSKCEIPNGEICNDKRVVVVDKAGKFYDGVGCVYLVDWWYYCESGCRMYGDRIVQKCDPKGKYCDDLDECTRNDIYDGERCRGTSLVCREPPCPDTDCGFWYSPPRKRFLSYTEIDGKEGKLADSVVIVIVRGGTPRKAVWRMARKLGVEVLGQNATWEYYQIGIPGAGVEFLRMLRQVVEKYPFVEGTDYSCVAEWH